MVELDDYHSEEELAKLIKKKTGHGSVRTLRSWREKRAGPPWIKFNWLILYPKAGFESWLRDQVQEPARSSPPRKRAVAERGQLSTA